MMAKCTLVPIVASVSILPNWSSLPVVTILSLVPNVRLLPIVTNPRIGRVDPMAKVILAFLIFGVIAMIPACVLEIVRQPGNPHTRLRIQITESIERNQEDPHTMP
jgi:hypothetical protein